MSWLFWRAERPLRHFCYVNCLEYDYGLIIEIGPLTIHPLRGVKRRGALLWRLVRPVLRCAAVNLAAAYLLVGGLLSLAAFVTWSAEIASFPVDWLFHRIVGAMALLMTISDLRKAARRKGE